MKLFATKLGILAIYCIPFIVSAGLITYCNYDRAVKQAASALSEYVEEWQEHEDKIDQIVGLENKDAIKNGLNNYLKRQQLFDYPDELCKDQIKETILWKIFIPNGMFVVTLSLLPFTIIGWGMAGRLKDKGAKETLISVTWNDVFMKYVIGIVMALGWTYVFNPLGQGASVIQSFIAMREVISSNTLPVYVGYTTTMKNTVAAFLGWYLYMLSYFLYRYYKGDVLSRNIYKKLFVKFLFVYGLALILPVTGEVTVLTVFLMGFFPESALSMLKESTQKALPGAAEQGMPLSVLTGLTRWQIVRLEEEEISSVSSLATADPVRLKEVIPKEVIDPALIDYWMDIAKLMTVVGLEKYKQIEGTCKTASTFIQKSTDQGFRDTLKTNQILNVDEIAKILKEKFNAS